MWQRKDFVDEFVMAAAGRDTLAGLRILVVEDTWLVADMIVEELTGRGCEVVGPASRVEAGVALARHERLDGALLDVNLGGSYCFPIAATLIERAIPFVFLTGYGESVIPPEYRGAPRLPKPFDLGSLSHMILAHFRD